MYTAHVRVTIARFPGLLLIAHGEFMSPFRAAAGEDFSAVLGFHALAESVLVLSFAVARLKRSFHRTPSPSSNYYVMKKTEDCSNNPLFTKTFKVKKNGTKNK